MISRSLVLLAYFAMLVFSPVILVGLVAYIVFSVARDSLRFATHRQFEL